MGDVARGGDDALPGAGLDDHPAVGVDVDGGADDIAVAGSDEPHAATDISMVPAAAMATRRWSMFLFIVFSSDVDIPSLMTAERQ